LGAKYQLFYGDGVAFHMVNNGVVWFEQPRYNVTAFDLMGNRLGKLDPAIVKVYRYRFLSDGDSDKSKYRVAITGENNKIRQQCLILKVSLLYK